MDINGHSTIRSPGDMDTAKSDLTNNNYIIDDSFFDYEDKSQQTLRSAIFKGIDDFWRNRSSAKAYATPTKEGIGKVSSLVIDEKPKPMADILDAMFNGIGLQGVDPNSSRHFANIPGSALPSASIADYYASTINKFPGIYKFAPGAATVERTVLDWIAEIFGFDKTRYAGCFMSGSSMGSITALLAAREAAGLRARDFERSVAYVSRDAHHCVEKALRFIGLGECVLRQVDVDKDRRMVTTQLEQLLIKDEKQGLKPFLVAGTLGTTSTGAIDDFSTLSTLAHQHGAWFHIDAAYGGFFALVDSVKFAIRGVEMADSICLDGHKSLFMPFGCAMLLVREGTHLRHGNRFRPNYIDQKYYGDDDDDEEDDDDYKDESKEEEETQAATAKKNMDFLVVALENGEKGVGDPGDSGVVGEAEVVGDAGEAAVAGDALDAADTGVSFCDFSPELTRGFRGLRVWLPLLFHGTLPFKTALKEKLQLARVCYKRLLNNNPGVVMGPYPQLSVVTFRFVDNSDHGVVNQKDMDNELNRKVQTVTQLDGTVFITNVNMDGWLWLRICILNFRTHLNDIEIAVMKVKEAYDSVIVQGDPAVGH